MDLDRLGGSLSFYFPFSPLPCIALPPFLFPFTRLVLDHTEQNKYLSQRDENKVVSKSRNGHFVILSTDISPNFECMTICRLFVCTMYTFPMYEHAICLYASVICHLYVCLLHACAHGSLVNWNACMSVAACLYTETGGPTQLPAQVAGRWEHIN